MIDLELELVSSNVLVVYGVCPLCVSPSADCGSPDCFNGLLPMGTADLNPLLTGLAIAGALATAERIGASEAIAGDLIAHHAAMVRCLVEGHRRVAVRISAELDAAYELGAALAVEHRRAIADRDAHAGRCVELARRVTELEQERAP